MSSIGFTGMERGTQDQLRTAFAEIIQRERLPIQLRDSAEADIVVVDMDSLYGPMSWMQLHNAGRKVIGYSASARCQSDYVLARPMQVDALALLLRQLSTEHGQAPATAAESTAVQVEPAHFTPAPIQQDQLPAEDPAITQPPPAVLDVETPSGAPTAPTAPVQAETPEDPAAEEPLVPAPATVPDTAAPEPAAPGQTGLEDPRLAGWLAPGRLTARRRYRLPDGGMLYLDPHKQTYHGPALLKPLEGAFAVPVSNADLELVEDAEWAAISDPAQPLSRLIWYGALLEGKGELLPQHDPGGRYRLNRWLQTEREYPKHFRIATAMMKGPATVQEIATAASVSPADAADFINACLATGVAEPVLPEPPAAPESARTGLFGLKRGR